MEFGVDTPYIAPYNFKLVFHLLFLTIYSKFSSLMLLLHTWSNMPIVVLVNIKPISVAVYSVKHYMMKDLLELKGKWFNYKHYLGPAKDMTLRLDLSPKNQKKGGFKLASFGTASQLVFGDTFDVCAKQTFYQKRETSDQVGQDVIDSDSEVGSRPPRKTVRRLTHPSVTCD